MLCFIGIHAWRRDLATNRNGNEARCQRCGCVKHSLPKPEFAMREVGFTRDE
jgi:hypothetical protein